MSKICANCLCTDSTVEYKQCCFNFYCKEDCRLAHFEKVHNQFCLKVQNVDLAQYESYNNVTSMPSHHHPPSCIEDCPICLEPVDQWSVVLPCSHVLHELCSYRLIIRSSGGDDKECACPFCRKPYPAPFKALSTFPRLVRRGRKNFFVFFVFFFQTKQKQRQCIKIIFNVHILM
jgi:hypothetical protein